MLPTQNLYAFIFNKIVDNSMNLFQRYNTFNLIVLSKKVTISFWFYGIIFH